MSSEEERTAMLEKIRRDMAASRKRLAEMRERKASVSAAASPLAEPQSPAEPTAVDKLSATTSLIERLKAEREAKKKTEGTTSQPIKKVPPDNSVATPSPVIG